MTYSAPPPPSGPPPTGPPPTGPPPAGPPPFAPSPASSPPRRGRALPVLLGLVAGVLVATLVGGLVVLLGGGPSGLGGAGGDVDDLPDEIAGVPANDSDAFFAETDADQEQIDTVRERNEQNEDYNADRLGEAFDGAEISSRGYYDTDREVQYSALAIGADAGPLVPFLGFPDPDVLQLAVPQNERTVEDDVECLLTYQVVSEDSSVADEDPEPVTVLCQRRDDGLTVRAQGNGGVSESDVREFTQSAWEAMS